MFLEKKVLVLLAVSLISIDQIYAKCSVGCSYQTKSGMIYGACGERSEHAMETIRKSCMKDNRENLEEFGGVTGLQNLNLSAGKFLNSLSEQIRSEANAVIIAAAANYHQQVSESIIAQVDNFNKLCAVDQETIVCNDYALREAKAKQAANKCRSKVKLKSFFVPDAFISGLGSFRKAWTSFHESECMEDVEPIVDRE